MTFDEIIEQLNEDSDKIIDDYIYDVVEASEEDNTKLLELEEAILISIFLLWNTAVDDIAKSVVEDINEQAGDDKEGSITDEQINHHKEAGVFFFSEAFRSVSYRVHGANIAIQLDDEDEDEERKARDEEIEIVIEKGKDNVHNSAFIELALAYGLFTKSEQIARGLNSYKWVTKGDNRVRPTHQANNGRIFSWESPPATGHVGTAHGCRCHAELFQTEATNKIETEFQQTEKSNMPKSKKDKLPFKILNMSETSLSINITGEIGDDWWDEGAEHNTMSRVEDVLHESLTDIDIYINSNGGDLSHGVAIYNLFMKHTAKVRTFIIGHAHSSASIIFMAGDERYMPLGATSIIHNPWSCLCGDYQDAEKYAVQMKQFAESIVDIYASRMTSSKDDIRGMLDREDVIIAGEALSLGYTTGEIDFSSGMIDSKVSNVVDDKGQIAEARGILASRRLCSLNTQNSNKGTKEDIMPRQRNSNTDDNELSQVQAKLSIAEKSNKDLKVKNTKFKDSEKVLQDKIEELKSEIDQGKETAKLDETKAILSKAGIEAVGETSDELKRDVLTKSDVKNAADFSGSTLDSMFAYVLEQSVNDDGTDGVYAGGVGSKTDDNDDGSDVFASTNKLMGK